MRFLKKIKRKFQIFQKAPIGDEKLTAHCPTDPNVPRSAAVRRSDPWNVSGYAEENCRFPSVKERVNVRDSGAGALGQRK